jgi:hypothetical protein
MKRVVLVVLIVVLALFAVIQLVPGPPRDNPPSVAPVRFPADVDVVMRAACMDCHSNETEWPWYSAVAPFSWYVARDVLVARSHLNFSNWEALPVDTRLEVLTKLWDGVVERRMPHKQYALMHPRVELNAEERKVIRDWAFALVDELSQQQATGLDGGR